MQDSNSKTLETYENRIEEYVKGTPHEVSGDIKTWIDHALEGLGSEAHILELGSGFGRDARYIQNLGYQVECTDATVGFVELLQEQGLDARELNALTGEIPGSKDLVLANAVLLHFTREETAGVLDKVYQSLNNGGRFAFSLKQGEGDGWSEEKMNAPRYFCYWQKDEIEQLIRAAGYANIEITGDHIGTNATWLHIIAHKAK